MVKSLPILVLLAATAAFPVAPHAQTPTRAGRGLPSQCAEAFVRVQYSRQAGATILRPDPGVFYLRPPGDRLYASAYDSVVSDGEPPRTVVDYRFAPDGLVGSVGYVRAVGGYPRDTPAMGATGFSRFGPQGALVGAELNYSFK